jgi:hypothetical protein
MKSSGLVWNYFEPIMPLWVVLQYAPLSQIHTQQQMRSFNTPKLLRAWLEGVDTEESGSIVIDDMEKASWRSIFS